MLFFALFTLGYFFGVFITLYVSGRKEKVGQRSVVNSAKNSVNQVNSSSWEVFSELTKPNFRADKTIEEYGKIATT